MVLGFRQEDPRFASLFNELEDEQCIRVSMFVEFVNKPENQDLFDRIFYQEPEMMPDPKARRQECSIL